METATIIALVAVLLSVIGGLIGWLGWLHAVISRMKERITVNEVTIKFLAQQRRELLDKIDKLSELK